MILLYVIRLREEGEQDEIQRINICIIVRSRTKRGGGGG